MLKTGFSQKSIRTFIFWMLWAAAAIGTYMMLYSDTDIIGYLKSDYSKVTWLIFFLFVLGVLFSFVLALVISLETIQAERAEDLARVKGLKGITVSADARRAVDRFYHSLQYTVDAHTVPDIETLVQVDFARFHRGSRFIEVLGNLLVTLGLIGTVIGLTVTLTGLTTSLEALGQDQELLLSGLRHAMSGMGTAFYTTLLGSVLGGVLLRIFAQITESGVEDLQEKLMRTCLVFCSADIRPSLEQDLRFLGAELSVLERRFKNLDVMFEQSTQALSRFIQEIHSLDSLITQKYSKNPAIKTIEEHREIVELLRKEHYLNEAVKHPVRTALKRLFRLT